MINKYKIFHAIEKLAMGQDVPPCQSDHYIREHWVGHQMLEGTMDAQQALQDLELDNGNFPDAA